MTGRRAQVEANRVGVVYGGVLIELCQPLEPPVEELADDDRGAASARALDGTARWTLTGTDVHLDATWKFTNQSPTTRATSGADTLGFNGVGLDPDSLPMTSTPQTALHRSRGGKIAISRSGDGLTADGYACHRSS